MLRGVPLTPDLILLNARIRTMDAARPQAQALAIAGGVILALGTDADILALAGPATRRLNGGGRLVLPGFQDAHVHLLDGGTDLVDSVALWEVTGLEGLQLALSAHVARTNTPMVTGAGWQPGLFGDHNLTRTVLDRAVPDRPCIAYDSSYHSACINSAACALIGLDSDTPDPANGHIDLGRLKRACAKQRLIGINRLEIAAYGDGFSNYRAVIQFQDRDLAERILSLELGRLMFAPHHIDRDFRQIDALFGEKDPHAARIGSWVWRAIEFHFGVLISVGLGPLHRFAVPLPQGGRITYD
jgi:hypothetical protein